LKEWTIDKFEKKLSVHFSPTLTCGYSYIGTAVVSHINCYLVYLLSALTTEELLFSTELKIGSVDAETTTKYIPLLVQKRQTGDYDNVAIAWINDEVGYGAYALKDFQPGDFVVRYGGHLSSFGW